MQLKDKIKEILLLNNDYTSGEELAKMLSVSRNAICKAIKELKNENVLVDGITNKGYKILNVSDVLSNKKIEQIIGLKDFYGKIQVQRTVTSTNKILKENASNLQEFHTLIAEEQTDGVGRFNRKFYSPNQSGIYFSVLLRPTINGKYLPRLTTVMAVAVSNTIDKLCNKETSIKWVNDIYLDGKKVCGILTEGSFNMETMMSEYVIIGVGINLYKPKNDFDDQIKGVAGAISSEYSSIDKNLFMGEILKEFYSLYQNILSDDIYKTYKNKLAFIGETVDIYKNNEKVNEGMILGIDSDFRLKIMDDNDDMFLLDSGEISIKRKI